jgi:hypothetical protein
LKVTGGRSVTSVVRGIGYSVYYTTTIVLVVANHHLETKSTPP